MSYKITITRKGVTLVDDDQGCSGWHGGALVQGMRRGEKNFYTWESVNKVFRVYAGREVGPKSTEADLNVTYESVGEGDLPVLDRLWEDRKPDRVLSYGYRIQ